MRDRKEEIGEEEGFILCYIKLNYFSNLNNLNGNETSVKENYFIKVSIIVIKESVTLKPPNKFFFVMETGTMNTALWSTPLKKS